MTCGALAVSCSSRNRETFVYRDFSFRRQCDSIGVGCHDAVCTFKFTWTNPMPRNKTFTAHLTNRFYLATRVNSAKAKNDAKMR